MGDGAHREHAESEGTLRNIELTFDGRDRSDMDGLLLTGRPGGGKAA